MSDFYLLKDKKPVLCNMEEWALKRTKEDFRVARDEIDDISVSTVFLGLDHNFCFCGGTPILFETMIFGGKHDQYQERYATYKEAETGHKKAVKLVKDK